MINRLGQRIKENFHETTRDLNLLTGGGASSSAAYFDASEDKMVEITRLIDSRIESERLEGMKRIIAGMSKGRNMEPYFAQVVKNVVDKTIEIRKLVYIYLLRYASTNSDLLLLSINTFQKDLSDPSPLIRSMSLRVLTSIRMPVIQGIVMLGLKKLINDRNPWVRKTVAGGLSKVYDMDSSTLPELIPLLQTLIASPSPLTLGATMTAFSEICPDRLDLLHPYYRHICQLLVDADEWGQPVILSTLTRYARANLEKPETAGAVKPPPKTNGSGVKSGSESEDEFEGIDIDLAMLLHLAKPLFHSRNPAVVLATAKMYYALAPAGNASIGQELLVNPLLRLAGSATADPTGSAEIATLTWDVIASMAEERPWLFTARHSSFMLHMRDLPSTKKAKLRAMIAVVDGDNAMVSIREFKHYTGFPETSIAEEAVRAIGHCVRTQPAVAATGLKTLMRLLKSHRGTLVAQAVIVLKGVVLSAAATQAGTTPERLVARLAKQLDNITNSSARASVFWLAGQFAADSSADTTMGLKWEGLAAWVPDVLRKGIKSFTTEEPQAKLQILTLAAKLSVVSPSAPKLGLMCQYLFSLARYDQNYDVRDRARFLNALLRGVRDEKLTSKEDGIVREEDEDEDVGGVTLRREQVKVVLLGSRQAGPDLVVEHNDFDVGSMSNIARRKLGNYVSLPEWTDDPTDPSLRESDIGKETKEPAATATATAVPMALSSQNYLQRAGSPASASLSSIPRNLATTPSPGAGSPAGSILHATRAKFRDLDDFLNSEESESEEDEDEDEDEYDSEEEGQERYAVTGAGAGGVQAPPRSQIAPEYDAYDESEEDDTEDEVGESSDEYDEYEVEESQAFYR